MNDTAKLMMHRLIARELARDPALAERARASLQRMSTRFPERSFIRDWDAVLRRPVAEVISILIARGETSTRLRLSSPFLLAEGIDFSDENLRRRIGCAAKRVADRGARVAARGASRQMTV